MTKLLLLLLCMPLIGIGQNKKELKSIISQKNDSLRLLEEQLLIQKNQLLDKFQVQEDSLSILKKEIFDLKQELDIAINETNEDRTNVFHINAISEYDDMEGMYSDGWYDEDENRFLFDEIRSNDIRYNQQTGELAEGKVYLFYDEDLAPYNGYLESEYNFIDGKLHGIVKLYNHSNTYFLEKTIEYKNGERNGFYREFYKNGQLEKEEYYIDDKLDGEFKSYYIDGSLRGSGKFSKGLPIGVIRFYYENGILKNEEFFSDSFENHQGELLQKWYYENGQLRKERYNEDRETSKCWDEDGNEIECH